MSGKGRPSWAKSRQYFDMRDAPLHVSAFTDKRLSMKLTEKIQQLAREVAQLLQKVPSFNPTWVVAEEPVR